MIEPELYIRNAVALLASLVTTAEIAPGIVRAEREHVTRLFTTRPTRSEALCEILAAEPAGKPVVAEDSFGTAPAATLPEGVTLKHMPVMIRPAGPIMVSGTARRVSGKADFGAATEVVVKGFPALAGFPPSIMDNPQWHFWLARRDAQPAAAGYAFDDGESAGIYLLATLPEHRGHGLARTIMTHAIAASSDRPMVLVATMDGQLLYEKLGFKSVSMATWYTRT